MGILLGIFILINYIYEDNDSLLIINDSLVMCNLHQYNKKVHLNNARLKLRLWNGADSTGKIILQAPLIHIHNSSVIQGDGYGYPGGTNTHPDGDGPGYGHAGVSGGGGGAGRLSYVDGFGGNGGALIYLKGNKIIIDSSAVSANGMRGYDGSYEAGGGGSGGGIFLFVQ